LKRWCGNLKRRQCFVYFRLGRSNVTTLFLGNPIITHGSTLKSSNSPPNTV
jgi:hypothetical protein